MFLAVFY